MSGPMPRAQWDRRLLPLVTVVPYVLLAILTGVTVAIRRSNGDLPSSISRCAR